MGQGLELTGLVGTLALAVPLLILFLIVVRGTRSRSKRRIRASRPAVVTEGAATAAAAPALQPELAMPHADRTSGASVADPGMMPTPSASQEAAATGEEVAEAEAPPPDPIEVARARALELASEAAKAEAEGRERDLPTLHLEEAKALAAAGDAASAADRLRMSLRASARLGLKLEHARGRIELGDLAAQHGDLTTACEHWSIARSLVHELKRGDDIKGVEARMRNNGCPTDWVLNDF